MLLRPVIALYTLLAILGAGLRAQADEPFQISPADISLKGNFAQTQLLVTGPRIATVAEDLTSRAEYASSNEAIVTVSPAGRLIPRGDGTAEISIMVGGAARKIPVTVSGVVGEPAISFLDQVRPAINKAGCSMAACHAAQFGKGGFKLSVFGFDPAADHFAMTKDSLGRRLNPLNPEDSLLLRKPTMGVPHLGGRISTSFRATVRSRARRS